MWFGPGVDRRLEQVTHLVSRECSHFHASPNTIVFVASHIVNMH